MMMTTTTTYAIGQKAHKFELAGLAKGPYVFLGVSKRVYQACQGAPVQPGSSCDYCGNAIMFEFWLRGADGKEFKVGSDCILKTDSPRSLVVAVKSEVQKRQAELRKARAAEKRERDAARIGAARERLAEVADVFSSQPHPNAATNDYFAGKTLLDWANWMLENAGMSGRLSVAIKIEKALAELHASAQNLSQALD